MLRAGLSQSVPLIVWPCGCSAAKRRNHPIRRVYQSWNSEQDSWRFPACVDFITGRGAVRIGRIFVRLTGSSGRQKSSFGALQIGIAVGAAIGADRALTSAVEESAAPIPLSTCLRAVTRKKSSDRSPDEGHELPIIAGEVSNSGWLRQRVSTLKGMARLLRDADGRIFCVPQRGRWVHCTRPQQSRNLPNVAEPLDLASRKE